MIGWRGALFLGLLAICAAGIVRAADEPLRGPVRMGAVGFAGKDVKRSIGVVADYLGAGLRAKVEVTLYPKYDEILAALEQQKLDLAILTPINFILAEEKLGVQPIANPIYQSGEGNYRAVILALPARKDISQLLDLKGKKVAFVDPHSASGYVVPRGMLDQAGLKGSSDVAEVFTGNHVKSIEELIKGSVDAAATYDMLLSQTPALGKTLDDFSVLARSEPIPGEVLVGAKSMLPGHIAWIKALLLDFGKKREEDKKLQDCFYQWFFGYDATRYTELKKLAKASAARGK